MAFITDIIGLATSRQIEVHIDPVLLGDFTCPDNVRTNRIVQFGLYKLIYYIGAIQSRRFATSNRLKWLDKTDLIEKIYSNTDEFRIKIDSIRHHGGNETLKSISEDFGVGISVILSDAFFGIRPSTIQRIYSNAKRPDWKCQTRHGQVLVVEAKGASSLQTSNSQVARALVQKTVETGDIKVASLTLLNENSISSNRFLDPPIETNEMSEEMQNHILRAGHYATVFSFLGSSRLSRYYSQMRKRLEGQISRPEQSLKNQTFRNLYYSNRRVPFHNREYSGTFYKVENSKFIYVGVDIELLSYQGFLNFTEHDEDLNEQRGNDRFIRFRDGILIIEITQITNYSDFVEISSIKNYQEQITISDIDEMNEVSLVKYFEYILQHNDFYNIQKASAVDLGFDLAATHNEIEYFFEFKTYKKKKKVELNFSPRPVRHPFARYFLVTNALVERFEYQNVALIERRKLEQIVKHPDRFVDIINSSPNTA